MTHKKFRLDLANWFTSALALVPMLLWPCFVHASCCCSERVRLLERMIATGELTAVARSAESASSGAESANSDEDNRFLEAGCACSKCCAAAANAARSGQQPSASDSVDELVLCSAAALCNCLIESPRASLAPRVEVNYEAEQSLCVTITLPVSDLRKSQALTSLHGITNTRIPLTSNERCALTSCWLN